METNIHPQVRRLVVQLCEAYNIPLTEVKLKVWQDKLKIPNSTVLKETYDIITDGRGSSLKMPSVAEFMQIYKERDRLYTRKRIETSQQISDQKRDYSKSKKMFSRTPQLGGVGFWAEIWASRGTREKCFRVARRKNN